MSFEIIEPNLTALPFGLVGSLPRGILQDYLLEEKEILEENEETFEPFGHPPNANQETWILALQNRFEVYREYEFPISTGTYRITVYKFFEEEKKTVLFRGRNYAIAEDSSTWLALIEKDTPIQLNIGEVDALLVFFGSINSNNRRIQMIAKILSKIDFEGELRHLKLSSESKQTIMSRLISEQIRVKLKIISGAPFSTALTIDSTNHTDITEPLEDQGLQFEEERRDGFLTIGDETVYSRVTEGAGLHIRNKIDLAFPIVTLLEVIIPSTQLDRVVKTSSIEFELRRLTEEDRE